MIAVGVLASAPVPGCKPKLLDAYTPAWIAGLAAAMLRDTLDGLQSVDAQRYVVFLGAEDEASARAIGERHVPAPWEVVAQEGADRSARMVHAFSTMMSPGITYALLAASDAPSLPTDPLVAVASSLAGDGAFLLGPSEDGGCYLIGMPRLEPRVLHDLPWGTPAVANALRDRCREGGLSLRELPPWYDVDEPASVLRLFGELRQHPERAPRTAQFLVTTS